MRINSLINSQFAKEIRIVPKHSIFQLRKNLYSVISPKGETMGQFGFQPDGLITDLELSKRLRRKKDGLCALFAIKKFVTKKARKENFDYISFFVDDNSNNITRLYERFAILVNDMFMFPVSSKGRKRILKISYLAPLTIA